MHVQLQELPVEHHELPQVHAQGRVVADHGPNNDNNNLKKSTATNCY